MDISIIGTNGECIAVLVFKTEAVWVPMDKKDIGKTAEFLPNDIYEIQISYKNGKHVRIPLARR